MDHATIISLNFRNMFTIVVMVLIGWFLLHLVGNIALNLSGAASGNVGPVTYDYSTDTGFAA